MFDLTGMTALVTGASGGIGSAIAQGAGGAGRAARRVGLAMPRSSRRFAPSSAAIMSRCACNLVRRRGGRRAGAAGGRGARPARHPGQQCRRHPRQSGDADEGRGMVRRDPGQPRGRLPPRPRGAEADDAGAASAGSSRSPRWSARPAIPARPIMPRPRPGWSACRRRWRRRWRAAASPSTASRPGFIRSAMTDVLPEAQKQALLGRIPVGELGDGERHRRGRRLSRQPRGRLRHRPDAARERRHGDDLSAAPSPLAICAGASG